jgi:outer membrane protein
VVLEVKVALRNVQTSYELIGATRAARRAAADSLRAIEVQEASGVALTPQFLINQKLSTQERLANAEVQEAQALTDYHNSIAVLYQSVGTLLERNNIEFRIEQGAD